MTATLAPDTTACRKCNDRPDGCWFCPGGPTDSGDADGTMTT